ncbi:T9SS type A sorting domain-containing protein [Flavobacterium sp. LT1R49]|uniref:T9SS type A sorting domain-containing protein n=1 Tax=Flavobacterium arabinosi TaxID=3398737 RepID=UPI003A88F79A
MKYLLIFFTVTFQGQVLHHQMLSSQAQSTKIPDGLIIKQTIGQQSLTGTSANKNYVVMQGFQQSLWGKYIASNNIDAIEDIKTLTYPNPFREIINFQFSKPVVEIISISIFDILGRLVYEQKEKVDSNILTINLARLPTSEYLVRLNTTNLNYYTKIIKQ